jgi:hypothetical protein
MADPRKLVEAVPEGTAKRAAKADADYRSRQKKALDEIDEPSPDKGKDEGEVGKKWDEAFK